MQMVPHGIPDKAGADPTVRQVSQADEFKQPPAKWIRPDDVSKLCGIRHHRERTFVRSEH
jgi:hypothetical protein